VSLHALAFGQRFLGRSRVRGLRASWTSRSVLIAGQIPGAPRCQFAVRCDGMARMQRFEFARHAQTATANLILAGEQS
jgi:hypothetical protein